MKEYIEKQQAIDAAREDGKKIPTLAIRIMHDIKAIPAADVVPVVRCKDCKYYKFGICMKIGANKSFYGFCDWAERGEQNE